MSGPRLDAASMEDFRAMARVLVEVEALCAEHERTVNPAPYTTERALIERLRAILAPEATP